MPKMPKNKSSKSKRKVPQKSEEIEKSEENIALPEVESETEVSLPSKKSKKEPKKAKQLTEKLNDYEVEKDEQNQEQSEEQSEEQNEEQNEEFDNKTDDKVFEKKKKLQSKRNKNKLSKEVKRSEQKIMTYNLGDFLKASLTKDCGEPQLNITSVTKNKDLEDSETTEAVISLKSNEWSLLREFMPQIDEWMSN